MRLSFFSKLLCVLCYVCFANFESYCQGTIKINPVIVTSPNGNLKMLVQSVQGRLVYSIDFNKALVIPQSTLGMVVNGKTLGENAVISKIEKYKINETYPYRGVHSTAVNKCNGVRIAIDKEPMPYIIEARAYDDGIAFRYVITNNDSGIVDKDNTEFALPASSVVWSQNNIKYYEGKYGKKKLEDFKTGELAGPPATIELPGNMFAAITEGGLTDFAGMSLVVNKAGKFQANLTGKARKRGNIESPWRIVEVGKDLNTLVNCDIVANVSPPYDPAVFPKGYNTDWVKPGRSVWSWLAVKRSITLPNMKGFSDLAAQLGFEYNLVDEGWSNWKDTNLHRNQWDMMKELVDYSATKGVKIWVWKAYPDRGGIPGIKDPVKRREFFQKCKDLGIAGMKVDFFDSEAQEIVDFYQAALKDAAEFHLMMDFHGANKPTGEERTWPNEMSREAIRGMENQPPWAPANTILPFTRYLAGHADYTPVHFGNRIGEVTWAHHVASMVVFTSEFLCVGADPQSILDNPAKTIIQSVPPTWDETIVLPQSKIGELVLYARRKGDTWFVAAMNGVHESKTINVDLSFLKKGNYKLSSMKDDSSKQASALFESSDVTAKSTFTINLNPEGGFVGRFDKSK